MNQENMTEFEWRRQLRELRQPLVPQRDLWVSIDAALDGVQRSDATHATHLTGVSGHPSTRHARRLLAAGLAAAVLLACGIGWQTWQHAANPATVASNTHAPAAWKPADPRLAGAAIELDAARMELQLAIRQAPDSAALQRLLDHTEQQQTQLRQLARQAG